MCSGSTSLGVCQQLLLLAADGHAGIKNISRRYHVY
jgi:hypothetical protein